MKKTQDTLSQLSSSQLGKLFPIRLREYSDQWPRRYRAEEKRIRQRFGNDIVRISHYGSTSIPGMYAKPTIDILLEIKPNCDLDWLDYQCEMLGYRCSMQPNNPAPHRMYLKGYTEQGFTGQCYHLHVRYPGDWDELYFRDYLCTHPDCAKEYANLKRELAVLYRTNRDAYTDAKGPFIRKITLLAREMYAGRHVG